MQINIDDKKQRFAFLNTPMPPLRLTRFSMMDLAGHTKQLIALGVTQKEKEECWARFFNQFKWN